MARRREWILFASEVNRIESRYYYQCEGERTTIIRDHATGRVKTSGRPAPIGLLLRHSI